MDIEAVAKEDPDAIVKLAVPLVGDVPAAQLATFVDRARNLWRDMARQATREREALKELFHARFILWAVWISLTEGTLEINVAHKSWASVTRTRNINHVQIKLGNNAVKMGIDEILARRSSPVTKQKILNMFSIKWLAEQGIIAQVDLANR